MSMLRCVLILFLAAVSDRPTDPADPPTVDRETVRRLIRRLDSGSLAVRDAAERELVGMGTAVLPLVVEAAPSAAGRPWADDEREIRRRGIQRALERLATSDAVDPSLVTLSIRNATASEVLTRLFAASGNRLEVDAGVDGPDGRRFSIDWGRATFWEAAGDVLREAQLALEYPPASGPRIVRRPNGDGPPTPAGAFGPLRVEVCRVEPTGGRFGGVRLIVRMAWEPRLEPLLVRLPMASVVAEGPAGEAVLEADAVGRRGWLDLPLVLPQSTPPLESLGLLRGTFVLWLAGLEQAFEVDLGMLGDRRPGRGGASGEPMLTLRVAQAEVSLRRIESRADRLLATVRVVYDERSEALASHRTWLASRPLELIDAAGRSVERVGQSVEERSERGLTTTGIFRLDGDGGPANLRGMRIRWKLPIAIHEVPVDFAIRGVALPSTDRPARDR
ncbi:MAG: hypothetical protein EBZ59_00385 [Planctomycetia bacterium]|nr:hypothetical protein [Planctomycetia bacterium]